jgi:ribosomal protein S27AE
MKGKPCPRCGGDDRFYFIAAPRNGGKPFWHCRWCGYVESESQATVERVVRKLSPEETTQAHKGYTAIANWCHSYLLLQPAAAPAREYLAQRGFSLETIKHARIGFHPDTCVSQAGTSVFGADRAAYDGARIGGLLGPQSRTKGVLRGTITIPYISGNTCTLIRGRKLNADDGAKYLSPAGISLYAGGTPTLYLEPLLDDTENKTIILTEGEFKALLAWQYGFPAVAQPGIGYLPKSYIERLKGKTVVILYDSEKRKDPFTMSAGEKFTIHAIERLTGIWHERQIRTLEQQDSDGMEGLMNLARLETLNQELETLHGLGIKTRVVRLPREPDQDKVDLDGFLLAHGEESLKHLIDHAKEGRRWHEQHSGGEYFYQKGGIWNGSQIANYQARIMETIYKINGLECQTYQRLAFRTPSGKLLSEDIAMEDWAEDRAARKAVRISVREGTFSDNPREILQAIRALSNQGDPPVERTIYMATGWEHINGQWHYLVSDGAITAKGITNAIKAEIAEDAVGNHYHMCGDGDSQVGAKAWVSFLYGAVCPQPLALILAAHAALPLMHRWMGNSARSMAWIFNETGSLKTALVRAACMALYGPKFTAEMADGAAIPKWDATSVGLGYLVFTYRDMPLTIDDFKLGVINPNHFKTFLHNYSEGTGRTRGRMRTLDKMYPARAIIFSTAEDTPIGDPGMMARIMPMQLKQGAINEGQLAKLQRAGEEGHLAAFWRQFVQAIAAGLDHGGEKEVQKSITEAIRQDDAQLPGHRRTQGSLRMNRSAFLILTRWLCRSGYITETQRAELNDAHLEARHMLADVLEERQRESRASTIFLDVLSEIISSGDLVIEQEFMECPRCGSALRRSNDGYYCDGAIGSEVRAPCTYHLPAQRIVGFATEEGSIAILPQKAFQQVSRVRRDQNQPFAYNSTAIWHQLDTDGYIVARGKSGDLICQKRNMHNKGEDGRGKLQRVILLQPSALKFDTTEDNSDSSVFKTMTGHDRGDLALSDGSNQGTKNHDRGMTGHDRTQNLDCEKNPGHGRSWPVMVDHDREHVDNKASNGHKNARSWPVMVFRDGIPDPQFSDSTKVPDEHSTPCLNLNEWSIQRVDGWYQGVHEHGWKTKKYYLEKGVREAIAAGEIFQES